MSQPIVHSIEVRCSVAHAFAVFTDRLDTWWPVGHRQLPDARLQPHRLSYTWRPGALTLPTSVEIRFTADGDVTRVEVVHAEGDSALGAQWPQRATKFDAAWRHVLPAFASQAEQPTPSQGTTS